MNTTMDSLCLAAALAQPAHAQALLGHDEQAGHREDRGGHVVGGGVPVHVVAALLAVWCLGEKLTFARSLGGLVVLGLVVVHVAGDEVAMPLREFELLEYLMRNERIVVPRQRLLEEVWGYDPFATTNTIEVFVSNLRRKLEAGDEPRLLHTIRGAGYVLRA